MLRGFPNLMSPDPSLSASALHRDSSGLGGEGWDTAMAVGGDTQLRREQICRKSHPR